MPGQGGTNELKPDKARRAARRARHFPLSFGIRRRGDTEEGPSRPEKKGGILVLLRRAKAGFGACVSSGRTARGRSAGGGKSGDGRFRMVQESPPPCHDSSKSRCRERTLSPVPRVWRGPWSMNAPGQKVPGPRSACDRQGAAWNGRAALPESCSASLPECRQQQDAVVPCVARDWRESALFRFFSGQFHAR